MSKQYWLLGLLLAGCTFYAGGTADDSQDGTRDQDDDDALAVDAAPAADAPAADVDAAPGAGARVVLMRGAGTLTAARASFLGADVAMTASGVPVPVWAELEACVASAFAGLALEVVTADVAPAEADLAFTIWAPGNPQAALAGYPEGLTSLAEQGCEPSASYDALVDFTLVTGTAARCALVVRTAGNLLGLDRVNAGASAEAMNLAGPIGAPQFTDEAWPCVGGACACGGATQNSRATLQARFGDA